MAASGPDIQHDELHCQYSPRSSDSLVFGVGSARYVFPKHYVYDRNQKYICICQSLPLAPLFFASLPSSLSLSVSSLALSLSLGACLSDSRALCPAFGY